MLWDTASIAGQAISPILSIMVVIGATILLLWYPRTKRRGNDFLNLLLAVFIGILCCGVLQYGIYRASDTAGKYGLIIQLSFLTTNWLLIISGLLIVVRLFVAFISLRRAA